MEQQQQEGLGWNNNNNNNNNNNKRNGGANSRVASTSKGDAEKIKESSPKGHSPSTVDSETGFAAALGCARRKSDERRGCADADNEAATTPAIRRSSQPAARRVALSAAAMGIGTTTKGRVRTPTHSALLFAFISLNREAARAELDVHAFGLMAVLIKLITQYGDGDRKRADDKIKHVGASHGGVPRRNRFSLIAKVAAAPIRVAAIYSITCACCVMRGYSSAIASKGVRGPIPFSPHPARASLP